MRFEGTKDYVATGDLTMAVKRSRHPADRMTHQIGHQGTAAAGCGPLIFFDGILVKIRDEGFVRNKAAP